MSKQKIQHPLFWRLSKQHIKLAIICFAFSLPACQHQKYQAKPISVDDIAAQQINKNPNNSDFLDYLITQGYSQSQLPISEWQADNLSLCAFYFHPEVEVSKQQLALAETEQSLAQLNNSPSISVAPGRSDDNVNPWTFGLSLSIPISTNQKRSIALESTQHLSEAARINIAEKLWQIRQRVHVDFTQYQYYQLQTSITQEILMHKQAIVAMLEKRLATGYSATAELTAAQVSLKETRQSLSQIEHAILGLSHQIAQDIGLTYTTFSGLPLNKPTFDEWMHPQAHALAMPQVQTRTVLNRLDIRAALARYAAQEAKLKLEYAKQIPDLSLNPSYNFEEGINFWSLGITTLLRFAQNNNAMIAKANALRDVEAAQFNVLQYQVVANAENARIQYVQKLAEHAQLLDLQENVEKQTAQTKQRFAAGFADRLELTQGLLTASIQKQASLQSALNVKLAALALEDAMQIPLSSKQSLANKAIKEVAR